MTKAQRKVVAMLQDGYTLMWFGDNGPEMGGCTEWPQKRTVRALIRAGVLRWGDYLNETHRECGIRPVVLTEATDG